jgi:hypothetical protein
MGSSKRAKGLKKMMPDAGEMPVETVPERSPKTRKVRLRTLDDLDCRSRAARHALELRDGFLRDLGGEDRASVAQCEMAQRASILGAMLEDDDARWLRGEPVNRLEYATLSNAQRRVCESLGFERKPKDITPDLRKYIEQKSAKQVPGEAGAGAGAASFQAQTSISDSQIPPIPVSDSQNPESAISESEVSE